MKAGGKPAPRRSIQNICVNLRPSAVNFHFTPNQKERS
jgi:hypothetical protein